MAVEGYRRFVRRHQALLALLESAVTTVTWLLPDRFAENEFTLEGIHTVANLISVFHDSILNDVDSGAPKGAQELTLALNALQQVEVLVELYAMHSNSKNEKRKVNRYDALFVVEALKALVRLAILRKSGRHVLLHGGAEGMFDAVNGALEHDGEGEIEGEREVDGGMGSAARSSSSKANRVLKGFQAFREARTPLKKDEPLKTIEEAMERTMQQAHKRLFTGEMLHVLRPVVYVATLRIWGIKSWKPWLIGLTLELLSAEATKSAWATSNDAAIGAARELAASTGSSIASLYAKQGIRLDLRDMDEISRRKVLLIFYLIRDPLFSRRTRPVLQACVRATSRVPLLSSLISFPVNLLEGIQRAKASVRRVLKSRDILSEPEPGWQFKWVGAKRVAQKKFPAKTRDNVYKLCSKYCSKKVSQKYLVGNVYVPSNGKSKWKCTCMTTKNDCSYRYMDAGVQNSDKWFGFKGNGVVIPEKDYEDAYRHEGCDVCWDGYKFSPCQD